MELTILWYVVAGVLIAIGLVGTVLPILPGVPIMFGGMWLAAWAGQYERVGVVTLVLLGILAAVSIALDSSRARLAPSAWAPAHAHSGARSSARWSGSSSASRA